MLITRNDGITARRAIAVNEATILLLGFFRIAKMRTVGRAEQFNAELLPRLLERGGLTIDHEAVLKDVFFKALFQFMRRLDGEMAIVVDSPTALPDKIKIQGVREAAGVYKGGIIYAESWREEGLQLADLAAYTLNRVFHIKQRLADGKANRFDEVIDGLYKRLRTKLIVVDLLVAFR